MLGLFNSSKDSSHLSNAGAHAAKAVGHLALAALAGGAAFAFGTFAVVSMKATMPLVSPAYFLSTSSGFVGPMAIMVGWALENSVEGVSEAFSAMSEVCNATAEGVYSVKDAFTDAFSSDAHATGFDAQEFVHKVETQPYDWNEVVALGEDSADAASAA